MRITDAIKVAVSCAEKYETDLKDRNIKGTSKN